MESETKAISKDDSGTREGAVQVPKLGDAVDPQRSKDDDSGTHEGVVQVPKLEDAVDSHRYSILFRSDDALAAQEDAGHVKKPEDAHERHRSKDDSGTHEGAVQVPKLEDAVDPHGSKDDSSTHEGVVHVPKLEDTVDPHSSEDALATQEDAGQVKKPEDAHDRHRSKDDSGTNEGAVQVPKLEDAVDPNRSEDALATHADAGQAKKPEEAHDPHRNQECLHSQQVPNPDMKVTELEDKSRETRRLHIENQYLKLILDRIHRIINVGEARSNIELKPPEDLENDQSVNELTTNLANVELKFYDLERELDYIHVKISELANMIAGGEGSDVTLSPEMANQCKALGLKPRCNPAEANKQSERSFKLDKDLERVTSSWRDMKEKNTEKIKRLKDRIEHLESLIKNLYDHVDTAAEGSDQPPESSVANIYQYIQYIYERIMKLESSNKEYAETNFYLEEILAALDSYCSSKTETKDNRLGKGNTFASRCSGEYKRAEQIADRFKEMKKEKFILEERNKTMQNSISCLQKEKVDMNGKYQRMKEEQKQQNQEITRLRHAEERLLTRLNKIAGDRFTHDNVNIADFSDTDRPMKLSETYSELYDNEWTDAFDELTENMKLSDEAAIRLLLKILMNAFRKCKEVTWDRYESLKLVASCLDVKQEQLPSMTTEEEQICMQSTSLTSTLSIDQEKSLKKIWRTATIYLKDEMLKLLCANLLTCLGKPETEMPKTSKYLTCCTELCWKMGVQEKPMHLDVNAEKQVGEEKQFDTDRFRAYTKTGKSVAYVVWPAMFLHEGGAMLAKGRAQGCQKRVSSKE